MADYHGMWKELNIDLKTHDLLCDALPPLYEGIYLDQGNRPETMDYFNMVVAEVHGARIKELMDFKAKGNKVVGAFCIYVPEELVLAAGSQLVGLCAGSEFWVPPGEKVLPRNTCPLVKAGVGARISRTCPYFQSVDLIVGENTCDGKKKAWEILAEEAPMYVMDIPNVKSRSGMALWKSEVKSLSEKLEKLTGKTITSSNLKEAIEKVNAKRIALQKLNDLRKGDVVPISGKDALLVSEIAFYDDVDRFVEKVQVLTDECVERVQKGETPFNPGAKRIMVTGSPLVLPNWKLHHLVESTGNPVVVEENCTGTRYYEQTVDGSPSDLGGLMDNLASRYIENIHCACFTPNDGRLDDIVRLAKEYRVDGIIDYSLSFCTTYLTEGTKVRDRLKQEGIPVLSLETGYESGDEGQLKTRIEAFIETLE
ncbi:double-cubane-cluster-containing anaerobic reductase [Dethiosulfovibrio acidaminovorans]|nr:double-cubane-cluster-containing anaerobic reductase [Dethiosulfovibrio acidaminovorans]MCF4114859.1 2-hydroxyacyl-CoA dehydratase family protein [Dethiosulfovibrio russensis]